MKELLCKNCGAGELVRRDGSWVCPYCGSRFLLPEEDKGTGQNPSGTCPEKAAGTSKPSAIALDDDISRLLKKCREEPRNARRYANLILDIDPDNTEALAYLRRKQI